MTGHDLSLTISVFLASAVEAVEALTIVLALGSTRSWSSTLGGAAAAIVSLAAVTAVLGPALTGLPIDTLRVIVGGILLIFGLQWLRKAILRASGYKALHDEELIFREETAAARSASKLSSGFDAYSFTLSFKGVFLEGMEVVLIVLTFGANQNNVSLAAVAALAAVLVVALAGIAIRAPLAKVPENAMKFVVGIMLSSYGLFWGAEGAGASWPGSDAALLVIIPAMLLFSLGAIGVLRRAREQARLPAQFDEEAAL